MKYSSKVHRVTYISIGGFNIKIIIRKWPSKVHPPYTYTCTLDWPDNSSPSQVTGIFVNESGVLSEAAKIISNRYSFWADAELSKLKRRLILDMVL